MNNGYSHSLYDKEPRPHKYNEDCECSKCIKERRRLYVEAERERKEKQDRENQEWWERQRKLESSLWYQIKKAHPDSGAVLFIMYGVLGFIIAVNLYTVPTHGLAEDLTLLVGFLGFLIGGAVGFFLFEGKPLWP